MTESDAFWDPLAELRHDLASPPLDIITTGLLFFDLIFTGLPRLPHPGEELSSAGMGSCPGGIANLATATARLGLRTGLVAGFGDDAYADWMWHVLEADERIDLSASRRFDGFHSALTVSMAFEGDRGMVTHAHDLPESLTPALATAPAARAAAIDLLSPDVPWALWADRSTLIFADVGFDDTGRWDQTALEPLTHCHAFTPNAIEAMGYTRTDRPADAVRALADLVPLAVVTDGIRGAYAIDQTTGRRRGVRLFRSRPLTPPGPVTSSPPAWCWGRSLPGRWKSGCASRPSARPLRYASSAAPSRHRVGVTWRIGGTRSPPGPTRAISERPMLRGTTDSSRNSCPPTRYAPSVGPKEPSPWPHT